MLSVTFRCLGRIAIAAAISLVLGTANARAEDTNVTIDNFTFQPAELSVKVGTTVTWKNHDDIPHGGVGGQVQIETVDTDDSFRSHSRRRAITIFLFAAPA